MFYVAIRLSRANFQSKPHCCHCWTHTEASKAIHSREAGKKQCGNAVPANETGTSRRIFDFPPICHLLPASNMQNKWALSILQFRVSKLPKWWGFSITFKPVFNDTLTSKRTASTLLKSYL